MCCPSEHKRGLFDVWQIILEMILVKEKKDVSTKAVWGEKFKDGLISRILSSFTLLADVRDSPLQSE